MDFTAEIVIDDFIRAGVELSENGLFAQGTRKEFDCSVLNPPYRKINSDSDTRRLLRRVAVETSNMYSAFLSLITRLLSPNGEIVAITPRSFCNGTYFKPFRADFLESMRIRRIHVFNCRDTAFSGDGVLQENVIVHSVRTGRGTGKVVVSSSAGPDDASSTMRSVAYAEIIHPRDPQHFIRLLVDGIEDQVSKRILALPASIEDLGLSVSTGRVVDFRVLDCLRKHPCAETVPLIYPTHFDGGYVKWPSEGHRKSNAIIRSPKTEELLVASGYFVLLKRFSAKEEKRRVVAAIYEPSRIGSEVVGSSQLFSQAWSRSRSVDRKRAGGFSQLHARRLLL